jgi:hypothetical protein
VGHLWGESLPNEVKPYCTGRGREISLAPAQGRAVMARRAGMLLIASPLASKLLTADMSSRVLCSSRFGGPPTVGTDPDHTRRALD